MLFGSKAWPVIWPNIGLRLSITSSEAKEHVLQGSNFTGNSAANSQGGGLVVSGNSTSVLSNSTFQSNAAARGAGIYIANSSLTVQDSNFTFNAAGSAGDQPLHLWKLVQTWYMWVCLVC